MSGDQSCSVSSSIGNVSPTGDYAMLVPNRDLDSLLYDPMLLTPGESDNLQNTLELLSSGSPSGGAQLGRMRHCNAVNGHISKFAEGVQLSAMYTVGRIPPTPGSTRDSHVQPRDVFDKKADRLERDMKATYEKGIGPVSDLLRAKLIRELEQTEWMLEPFDLDKLAKNY